jgi:N-acetylneuraminic acid mutarotase
MWQKSLCLALFLLVASNLRADMVFLVEDENGKHVGLSQGSRGFALLTRGADWHLYPTISSDGKKLAYAHGTSANDLRLMLVDRSTGATRPLTAAGFILHPQFAKNSEQLFFSIKEGDKNRLAYINLIEESQAVLPVMHFLDEEHPAFFPAPFQSGEMIAYQRNAEKKEIVLYDILAKTKEVIGHGMAPALSKDEKYIAYTSQVEGNWDVYVYDRFSKKTVRATFDLAHDFSPAFDRENNLIYTSDRLENGVFSIFSQSYANWTQGLAQESLLISKKGTSFYAPRTSGIATYSVSQLPAMIGEARSSFGSLNYQDKVYVVGGHQGPEHTYPPESFTGRMTGFDLATGEWKNLAPRLNPSHGFQITAYDNSLFAFGGFAYEANNYPKWKSIDVVERYDIASDRWEEVSRMPRRRSSNVTVRLDDKVYLIGGWDASPKFSGDLDGTFHAEIDVFDLKTYQWTTLDYQLPKKRRAFNAFVKDGMIYLVGGISEGGSHFSLLDDFTQFDPKNGTFTEFPKLPFATFAPASGQLKDKAFVFGGMFKTGQYSYEYIPHIYQYDFSAQKWTHTGRYLTEYKGFSQVVTLGECLGIMGGHSYQGGNDQPLNTFEKFCL